MKYANSDTLRLWLKETGRIHMARCGSFLLHEAEFHQHLAMVNKQHPKLTEEQARDRAAYRCITHKRKGMKRHPFLMPGILAIVVLLAMLALAATGYSQAAPAITIAACDGQTITVGSRILLAVDTHQNLCVKVSSVTVAGTVTVTGPLTDTQLRASAVPVSIASMPSTPVTGTFWQMTQPVSLAGSVTVTDGSGSLNVIVDSGTLAATQSGTWNIGTLTTLSTITNPVTVTDGSGSLNVIVDSGTISLPSNAAQESGGNLATIAAKDFATSAKQDTGNTSLSTLTAKDFATSAKQDTANTSLATIAGAVHNEDAAAVDGEAGIKVLGRRNEALNTLTSADGDEGGLVIDPHGHLIVRIYAADANNAADQPLRQVSGGLLVVPVRNLPQAPCNALRRYNCASGGLR